jgi:ribosome-binding factor A
MNIWPKEEGGSRNAERGILSLKIPNFEFRFPSSEMLAGKRAIRVGDQILKEIAILLLNRVKDPRVYGATITGIKLSNDLKIARVYFSVIGEKSDIERALDGLNSAKGFIKREIGLRMKLRYVPEIKFVHDPSLESGSHLDKIFEEIHKSEGMRRRE